MSGFFGIIEEGCWAGFRLEPDPLRAASTIRALRDLLRSGRVPISYDHSFGLNLEDAALLSLLSGMVFRPDNAIEQMNAATAIALLIKEPFFYIEGTANLDACDCRLFVIQARSAAEAHARFMRYCCRRMFGDHG